MNRSAPDTTTDNLVTVVRDAREADAVSIARIYNHYVDAGGATFDTIHWQPQYVVTQVNQARPEGWFVAARQDAVIGWASVRQYSLRHGYRFTGESAIYLEPAALGCGAADRLQRRIDQHCQDHGVHHAVARIIAGNQRSMSFHYRHGYQLVGIQKEVGCMDDRWVDVAILQKVF